MAILLECPMCHKKQTRKNKLCVCGADLDKLKRQKQKVKYWNDYRIPIKDENGNTKYKQRREYIGFSIEDAKAASGKRKVQKKENRHFDMLPGTDITFDELTEWYLNLESVKALRSYDRIVGAIGNFNKVFGKSFVNDVLNTDLENYRLMRRKSVAPRTVDYEMSVTSTMVNKAFLNRRISGDAILEFKSLKNMLKKGSNARRRTASMEEYVNLVNAAAEHLKPIIITAFNTGMRLGEIRNLRWKHIDFEKGFIRFPASMLKEDKPKAVPLNHHVKEYRDAIVGHSAEGMDRYYLRIKEEDIKKAMVDYTDWLDAKLNKVEGNNDLVNKWSTNA